MTQEKAWEGGDECTWEWKCMRTASTWVRQMENGERQGKGSHPEWSLLKSRGLPGGSAVRNPPANAGDLDALSDLGGSRSCRACGEPHLWSPHAQTPASAEEKPPRWGACVPPVATTREDLQRWRPSTANKWIKIFIKGSDMESNGTAETAIRPRT